MAADTNSHSQIWGNMNNRRGKEWNEFIEDESLLVHNVGKIPTYESKIGKSIIDVTISYRLPVNLVNWRVLRNYNGTDHNTIKYNLERTEVKIHTYRQYGKANWEAFKQELESFHITIPSDMTEGKLDKMVSKLNKGLTRALDKACPIKTDMVSDPNNSWWNPYLKNSRRQVIKAYERLKNDRRNEKLDKYYKDLHKKYRKACKKAKKEAEDKENESVQTEELMAKKVKHLLQTIQPKLTTLVKDDGTTTEVGKETCEEIMNKHFPTNAPVAEEPYNHTKIKTATINSDNTIDWITKENVRRVLLKFKAKKSPGPDELKPIIFKYLPMHSLESIAFIYKSCIKLQYTPRAWKKSKVR